MNVVDGEKLKNELVDPALARIESQTVAAIEAAGGRLVSQIEGALGRQLQSASDKLAVVIGGALTGVAGVVAQADGDLSKLLAGLDGWTLQISVRLTAPGQLTTPKAIE